MLKIWHWVIPVVIFFVYLPSLFGPFAFDDFGHSIDNPNLAASPLQLNWTRPSTRPFVVATFAIDRWISGDSAAFSRLVNLGIHTLNTILLASILRRVTAKLGWSTRQSVALAILSATWWAIHPINTQAVAYIVQRYESLMATFYLLYLYAIVRHSETANWKWILLGQVFFLCGVYSKTVMVTAVLVGPLFDRAFLSKSFKVALTQRRFLYLPPIAIGAIAISLLIPSLFETKNTVGFSSSGPWQLYLAAQAKVIPTYLYKLLYPFPLSLDYGWFLPNFVMDHWGWLLLMSVWILLGVWAWTCGRQPLGFLLLAPLMILAPTSSFIPLWDLMVDHRMYLPAALILPFFVMAIGLIAAKRSWTDWDDRKPTSFQKIFLGASIVLLAFYAVTASQRAAVYRSNIALWNDVLVKNPLNARAAQNLWNAIQEEKPHSDAAQFYRPAIESARKKNVWDGFPLGRVAEKMVLSKRPELAIPILVQLTESDQANAFLSKPFLPRFTTAELASHHVNLALATMQLGRFPDALEILEHAFTIDDLSPEARAIAGDVAARLGQRDRAIHHLNRAIELNPELPGLSDDLERLRRINP